MEESKDKMNEQKDIQPNENAGVHMDGHILIRDKETGEELVNKRNAIHYGNMAYIVANALNGTDNARVYYMGFGNGGTSVDTAGKIVYKSPRVSEAFQSSASLYSRTYKKIVGGTGDDTNKIEVITEEQDCLKKLFQHNFESFYPSKSLQHLLRSKLFLPYQANHL